MNNISMVFCTTDSYSDTWNPFFTLLKKHWHDFDMPIYFCSDSASYSYEGFDIRCPMQGKSYKKRPSWSKLLYDTLKHVNTEYIFFILDDFWLTDDVDVNKFQYCLNTMKDDKKIGYICLAGYKTGMLNDGTNRAILCEYDGLLEVTRKCLWRIHAQAGIWRVKYLKKILKKSEDAWQFEWNGTVRSRFLLSKCYDVIDPVIKYPFNGVITRGKVIEEYFNLYSEEYYKPLLEKREILKKGDECIVPVKRISLWIRILSRIRPSAKIASNLGQHCK